MTGTPLSFADTPNSVRRHSAAERDLLGDMLRTLRLTGSAFLKGSFFAPFGVISPRRFDAATPLAHLRHISIFHLVEAGSCTIELANGERRIISTGDIVLMPFTDEHKFYSDETVPMIRAQDIIEEGPMPGMWTVNHGGDGDEVRMVCGFIESSEFLHAPVFRSLPPLIIDRTDNDEVSAALGTTVREIMRLAHRAAPGSELILGRLMEILFIEVVRRYATRVKTESTGLFAAINDPLISRAISLVQRDPARRWTVEDLAHESGTSRTVLAERFNAMLGQAPMEYVTGWRMQIAAERLRASTASLAAIAADIGYESEAAFNRAFKRVTGTTPGRFRDLPSEGTF